MRCVVEAHRYAHDAAIAAPVRYEDGGRGEVAPILVDANVVGLAPAAATYGDELSFTVKGRQSLAQVRAVRV